MSIFFESVRLTFLSKTANPASADLDCFLSSSVPPFSTGEAARTISFFWFWIFAQRSISFMICKHRHIYSSLSRSSVLHISGSSSNSCYFDSSQASGLLFFVLLCGVVVVLLVRSWRKRLTSVWGRAGDGCCGVWRHQRASHLQRSICCWVGKDSLVCSGHGHWLDANRAPSWNWDVSLWCRIPVEVLLWLSVIEILQKKKKKKVQIKNNEIATLGTLNMLIGSMHSLKIHHHCNSPIKSPHPRVWVVVQRRLRIVIETWRRIVQVTRCVWNLRTWGNRNMQ